MYDMSKWDAKFQMLGEVYRKLGAAVEYRRAEPASPAEITDLEKKLGQSLPPGLKEFLTVFSKDLYFSFRFQDEEMPDELYLNNELIISLDSIAAAEAERLNLIKECFTDPDDSYDKVWHDKLGFSDVPNGDIVALDPADPKDDKWVVYLSHDDGVGHGWVLATTFGDFMDRLIDIGDLRLEEWELLKYIGENDGTGLDPNCEAAEEFRQYIGLNWQLLFN